MLILNNDKKKGVYKFVIKPSQTVLAFTKLEGGEDIKISFNEWIPSLLILL